MSTWQMQEAKARLSEVVKRAKHQGPQFISVHGKRTAVVISEEEYARLTGKSETDEPSFLEVLRRAPIGAEDLVIERDYDDRIRDIDL
jgi:antitoxin Phd